MNDPLRWTDPASGAPDEVRALFAAARSSTPRMPPAVRLASAHAVAKVATGAAAATPTWTALKVVGLLVSAGTVAVTAHHVQERHVSRFHVAPAAARVVPSTVEAQPSAPEPAAPVAAAAEAVPPVVAVPEAQVAPASATHRRVAPSESELLERARRELALGETSQALSTLREHARTYPRSALAEERDYLTFRAGSRGAAPDGVARAAARFLAVHPSGIYSSQVRAMQDASR